MQKTLLIAAVTLVLGVVIGIYIGRSMAEREWSQPAVLERLSESDAKRSSSKDADPVPAVGSLILRKAPLAKAREAIAAVTAKDPVVMLVGAIGNGDDGQELHLTLQNKGACKVTAFSGTAYGYDAWGKAVPMNQGGEHYVAFSEDKVQDLPPGGKHDVSVTLHHVDTASLALAQIDRIQCEGGQGWTRQL